MVLGRLVLKGNVSKRLFACYKKACNIKGVKTMTDTQFIEGIIDVIETALEIGEGLGKAIDTVTEQIENGVELAGEAVDVVKDLLDDGKLNKSTKNGKKSQKGADVSSDEETGDGEVVKGDNNE